MKIDLAFIFSLLTVIYAVEDVYRKDQHPDQPSSSDKPDEIRRIPMPPKTIKIVLSPKPTPQPLRSLYKSYVGKKPLMRKFIPTVTRTTEQPITITRRSLMKQRQFVIGPSTIKPNQKKEDLFTTTRRRINFRPTNNNKTVVIDNDATKKEISEGRIVKSRIVAVLATDKSYGDLSILPKDITYAGSKKKYTIVLRPNSNIKNRSIESDSNDKIEKNGTLIDNNIRDKEEPDASAQDNSTKIKKTIDNHQNELSSTDQDSKEFIFIIPDSTEKLDNDNKVKTIKENDINKT